ncbi:LysR family transcriptional regulator [Lactiplantibacillus garii]|uniref:LysR family transcriptional regulator n=1 Tax=Lactiplantibacillus garii TaxID=2306423 RepID=A0A3R8J6X1_9LACO|nr:LysR family transcriptional regulator [Lactiplantibacillus garii]RRK09943.1 LysR family transcriptional regulator [Lactiplantibacillus garii]
MDLQQLQNFLIIAQEENITHAAEYLHISQPALSRQVKALEAEFGKPLLNRENKRVTLTNDGLLLRRRATEIIKLVNKTNHEMLTDHTTLAGDVLLGVSETDAIRDVGHYVHQLNQRGAQLTLKLRNGDNEAVLNMVNNGLVDLGLYFGKIDHHVFNAVEFSAPDHFGVLMPRNHPLAHKTTLTPNDLRNQPLILYQPALDDHSLQDWFQQDTRELNVTGTFGMYLSAKKLVESGLGIALVFDDLVDYHDTELVCRPITPAITVRPHLIWKKYQLFSGPAQALLDLIQAT